MKKSKKLYPTKATPGRDIPATLEIIQYIHCSLCVQELPRDESPASWSRNDIGFTKWGIQAWCRRHEVNIFHVDFQGQKHPANQSRADTVPMVECGETDSHTHGAVLSECDHWLCVCGNMKEQDGFFPVLADGSPVEPEINGWKGHLQCGHCERIIARSGRVVSTKVFTPQQSAGHIDAWLDNQMECAEDERDETAKVWGFKKGWAEMGPWTEALRDRLREGGTPTDALERDMIQTGDDVMHLPGGDCSCAEIENAGVEDEVVRDGNA